MEDMNIYCKRIITRTHTHLYTDLRVDYITLIYMTAHENCIYITCIT